MSTRAPALVLGLLFIVSFLGVGREPWTPDEPREAEISREMWLSSSITKTRFLLYGKAMDSLDVGTGSVEKKKRERKGS